MGKALTEEIGCASWQRITYNVPRLASGDPNLTGFAASAERFSALLSSRQVARASLMLTPLHLCDDKPRYDVMYKDALGMLASKREIF